MSLECIPFPQDHMPWNICRHLIIAADLKNHDHDHVGLNYFVIWSIIRIIQLGRTACVPIISVPICMTIYHQNFPNWIMCQGTIRWKHLQVVPLKNIPSILESKCQTSGPMKNTQFNHHVSIAQMHRSAHSFKTRSGSIRTNNKIILPIQNF
jgi:hypothetical protein